MLSHRVLLAARRPPAILSTWSRADPRFRSALFHSSRRICAETVKVPQMAESISEGTLRAWSKKVGDTVAADEEVATIETDKIDVSVNAPIAGTIVEILANEDDTVIVGQDLFRIEPGEGGASTPAPPPSQKPDSSEPADQQVEKGTPPPPPPADEDRRGGGVSKESREEVKKDFKEGEGEAKPSKDESKKEPKKEDAQKEQKKDKKDTAMTSPAAAPPPKWVGNRNETRVKLSRMRLAIAQRLKQSQNAAASLTTFNEIDMSALMRLRSTHKQSVLDNYGVKLGFMGFFSRAVTLALKEIPAANAAIEMDEKASQGEIVYRDYVDLSVAVATGKGLVTPVVRGVEGMTVVEIEKEIAELGKKARDSKLTIEDMAGGTFTISNGGVFGSLFGTPIINLPQAAVLGMHSIKDRPVVVDGQIVIRPIMVVALTYDHRLLDGREAVTFLVKVKEYIEDPAKMLLTL